MREDSPKCLKISALKLRMGKRAFIGPQMREVHHYSAYPTILLPIGGKNFILRNQFGVVNQ